MSDIIIVQAIDFLDTAKKNIIERDKSYNSNGVNYEDYQLQGLPSTFHSILECFVRLHNSKSKDKGADWVAYSALQASLVHSGIPQSMFSPIFNRFMPEVYKALKAQDWTDGKEV